MAEVLLRAALPKTSPWQVTSAGLAAYEGMQASEHAITAVGELGCDLRSHRSHPVTPERIREAEAIVAMTGAHAQQLASRFPDAQDRVHLLRSFDPDVSERADIKDPFCGSLDDYRQCRDFILKAIPGLVRFLKQAEQNAG
mgnify:CR=1 FL=1